MRFTTWIAYKILPSHTWSQIQQEWQLTHRRWRNSRHRAERLLKGKRGLRLHLGCGKRIIPGWINVDGFDQAGFDLRWDLRNAFPCEDGVASMVYSEHVLEHLERPDAEQFLREVFRLLQPRGRLRLGVPDAGLYLRRYAEGNKEFFLAHENLGNPAQRFSTPVEVINQMFRMGGHHRYAWDFETMSSVLERTGFVDVCQWPAGKASRSELCLDDPEHASETLYLEAEKPESQ